MENKCNKVENKKLKPAKNNDKKKTSGDQGPLPPPPIGSANGHKKTCHVNYQFGSLITFQCSNHKC